jgi:hypothetical protein
MKLQRTSGHQVVQRLLIGRGIAPREGLIQTDPAPAVPAPIVTPESAPIAEPSSSLQSEPDEILPSHGVTRFYLVPVSPKRRIREGIVHD